MRKGTAVLNSRIVTDDATLASKIDAMTLESLHASGSKKWWTSPDVIGATVAEMDFGVSHQLDSALRFVLDRDVLSYLPAGEQEKMRQACSAWLSDAYGWDVPVERIRPLPDVLRGLEAALTHFTSPGAAVILPTPTHVPFLTAPGHLGRNIIEVPMLRGGSEGWQLDLDAIDAAFAAGGELLVLCNPHNPIGKVYARDEMLALADVVERHGARVFSDEIHAPLVFPNRTHVPYAAVSPAAAEHAITATSASKGWNISGLKCAQLILSNDRDSGHWDKIGFLFEHGAGLLGSVATTAAYDASRSWLNQVLSYLDDSRVLLDELVDEHLPGVRYTPPDGTYLAWLDCTDLGLGDHPADFFLEHARVAVNDGAKCGAAGRGHVRLNLATPQPVLTSALERMGRALQNAP